MTSPDTLESIWKEFDYIKDKHYDEHLNRKLKDKKEISHQKVDTNNTTNNTTTDYFNCKNCNNQNVCFNDTELVCSECGLVNDNVFSNTVFLNSEVPFSKQKINYNGQFSKIQKMQEWYAWSKDEKNSYKLSTYTTNLCIKMNISEGLIPKICDIVNMVMSTIKKYEGTKRARVKDGIILSCIEYVANDDNLNISSYELAKKINLDIKYVSRADRMILELINNNKLNLKKNTALNVKTPIEYIMEVIDKNNLDIPEILIMKLKALIKFCETNDILIDHTPLSIGVCCFYYILKVNNINIDIKIFANLHDLSIVTILKTFNKLNLHSRVINRYLSQIE